MSLWSHLYLLIAEGFSSRTDVRSEDEVPSRERRCHRRARHTARVSALWRVESAGRRFGVFGSEWEASVRTDVVGSLLRSGMVFVVEDRLSMVLEGLSMSRRSLLFYCSRRTVLECPEADLFQMPTIFRRMGPWMIFPRSNSTFQGLV